MKKYRVILSLLTISMLASACDLTEPATRSDFDIACERSGGIMISDTKCQCLDVICDDGLVCNLLTKACPTTTLAEVCQNNSVICTNSTLYQCQNNQWAKSEDPEIQNQCKKYGCLPDLSKCAECTKDTCVDGELITCKNGVILNKYTCKSSTCEDDTKCKNVCNENEKTCKDSILYICKNDELVKEKDCPAGCDTTTNNTCASNCNEGSTFCADGKLKTCKNGVFDDNTSVSCDNGASCKSDKECGECKTGDTICENDQIKTCINGAWSEFAACPGNNSCKDNGKACGECTNGDTICENDQIKTCIDGAWSEFAACPANNSCKTDGKTCGECTNDEIQCSDDAENAGTIKTCVAGQWDEGTPCKDDASCKDEKTCGECRNGMDKCVEDSLQNLNNVGFVYQCTHGVLSDEGTQCMDNYGNRNSCNSEGTACGECLNGIDTCFIIGPSTTLYECVDGKRGNYKNICPTGCNFSRKCSE